MKKALIIIIVFVFPLFLISCNKDIEDTSELYAKSTTRGAIIERSGTTFGSRGTDESDEQQFNDAENRLRTGGGIFGKKPLGSLQRGTNQQVTSVGLPVNPYLWQASLETLGFMPLSSVDPFAGIIITDWYTDSNNIEQRCKLNVFIKGLEMQTSNLKVSSFCQILSEAGNWVDQNQNIDDNRKIENAILNKAKKIKLSAG